MTMRRQVWWSVVLLVASGVLGAAQVREHDASWTAPAKVSAKVNPLAGRVDVVAGGRKVFQQRCANCHGDEGRGTPKAPDLTHPSVRDASDGALFWKISSGNAREGMPSFSFLPEPQRWQVVLHLRELR
jgi:mono/diheme cytochrome c family protein